MIKKSEFEGGFTIVEVITTLFIVSAFLAIILQTYYVSNVKHQAAITRAIATNIAISNLNKFPNRTTAIEGAKIKPYYESLHPGYAPFFCKPGTNWANMTEPANYSTSQPDTNVLKSPNAEGVTILDNESTFREMDTNTGIDKLVNPVQRVAIYTPHGCKEENPSNTTSVNADTLKIESTVTYGPANNRNTVRIASYVAP